MLTSQKQDITTPSTKVSMLVPWYYIALGIFLWNTTSCFHVGHFLTERLNTWLHTVLFLIIGRRIILSILKFKLKNNEFCGTEAYLEENAVALLKKEVMGAGTC